MDTNVTLQIQPEQNTSSEKELRGWRKNVNWEPGTKLDIYRFLINPKNTCNNGSDIRPIKLLVLIKSAPGNTARRDAARRTHMSGSAKYNMSARLLFIIGDCEANQTAIIQEEAKMYGDTLQIDFKDGYYNLTIKLIMGFK